MAHGNSQAGRLPVLRERLLKLQGEMSITEFADMLGLTRQTVGYYINGDRIPDSEKLLQICQRCDVSADYLLGLTSDPKRTPSVMDELALSETSVNWLKDVKAGHIYGGNYDINWIFESKAFSTLIDSIFSYICAVAATKIFNNARREIYPPIFSDLIADGYTFEAAAEKIYLGEIKAPSQDEREKLDRKLWEKIDAIAFFNEVENYQVSKHLHALNQLYWASTAFQKGLSQTISSEQEYIDIAGHRVEREVFSLLEELRGHITEE